MKHRKRGEVYYTEDPKNSILPRIKLKSSGAEKDMVKRLYDPVPRITQKMDVADIRRVVSGMRTGVLSVDADEVGRCTLSQEAEDGMVERLYVAEKQKRIDLEARLKEKYYKEDTTPQRRLKGVQLERFVDRMYSTELEARKIAHEEARERIYVEEENPLILSTEEMDSSVRRLYYDSCEHSKDQSRSLEDRHAFRRSPVKRAPWNEIKSTVDRLAKAKPPPPEETYAPTPEVPKRRRKA